MSDESRLPADRLFAHHASLITHHRGIHVREAGGPGRGGVAVAVPEHGKPDSARGSPGGLRASVCRRPGAAHLSPAFRSLHTTAPRRAFLRFGALIVRTPGGGR